MSAINDLINQIENEELRERIQAEVDKLAKQKKFGLVFEEHLPECTPLYDIPVRRGAKVALKQGEVNDFYEVLAIDGDQAVCLKKGESEAVKINMDELVTIAEFGEPIYPCLKPVDEVCNAPDSDLWHTLIEADNYHALQLLEYLYAGKVDCIYIDPPYNTGAKDWKYNNDYVDSSDSYRHSKWLSMMQKRLILAKKLLKPDDGVLIVTIDEHEVHHLRTLLEEIFDDFYIQMCTAVINPKGVTQGRFSRVEEYIIYCFAKNAYVADSDDNLLNVPNKGKKPRWKGLLRSGTDALRADRESMFYPVYIDLELGAVIKAGDYLPLSENPSISEPSNDIGIAWPIRSDGSFGRWSVGSDTLNELISKGYVSCGRYDKKRKTWGISYISKPNQKKIEEGSIIIVGRNEKTNVVQIEFADSNNRVIKTVWHRSYHDAGAYGTDLITNILGESGMFSFPKSLYSVTDAIRAVLRNRSKALIVDFFAGSGTTLNAVNLVNFEDSGERRCILVTNNECSESEEKDLMSKGFFHGDEEWEKYGICKSVTWPRVKNSILGIRGNQTSIEGEYYTTNWKEVEQSRSYHHISIVTDEVLSSKANKKQLLSIIGSNKISQAIVKSNSGFIVPDDEKYTASILFDENFVSEYTNALLNCDYISDIYIVTRSKKSFNTIKKQIQEKIGNKKIFQQIKRPMSLGFKANAAYFKLGFLDKNSVALGRQFKEMLPTLWMKAGAIGRCPELHDDDIQNVMIYPENKFAVLTEETAFSELVSALSQHSEIEIVYIITDYEPGYRTMAKNLNVKQTYQLYRDYLDNFRINIARD